MNDIEIINQVIYTEQGKKMNYIDIDNIIDNEYKKVQASNTELIQENKELKQQNLNLIEENISIGKELERLKGEM